MRLRHARAANYPESRVATTQFAGGLHEAGRQSIVVHALSARAALRGAAFAAAALLALLVAIDLPRPAGAQAPGLSGDLAVNGGFSLAVWGGGTADDLLDAARDGGCNVRSVWANGPDGLVGYFPTQVSVVNRDFTDAYPGAQLPASTPVVVVCGANEGSGVQSVSLTSVLGGRVFDRPIDLVPYPGNRWLVAEQDGQVLLLASNGGSLGTVLDRSVSRSSNEEGLLSIALDPAFPTRPYLYTYYSAPDGERRTVLSRYEITGDAAVASSELVILEVPQPFSNHNGGAVRFGPDGMVYLGLGDGGSGGDPQGNGQNRSTLLGSVLRIDVANAWAAVPYVVPSNNPFVGVADARAEIWAYGFRNPWRMAFDSATGALWVGDVGQGDVEEVDIVTRGGNYGWNRLEGRDCYSPPSGCSTQGTTLPVASYRHDRGCSITGGVVYRGSAIPELRGHYLYGDFCSGRIWALPADGGTPVEVGRSGSVSSFGVGPDGEVYVLGFGDAIHRVTR